MAVLDAAIQSAGLAARRGAGGMDPRLEPRATGREWEGVQGGRRPKA
jgi:hypothetical protein